MAKRDSNIVLNTTDDGEPAVQRRVDAEESTVDEPINDESTDEPTATGVENPDGSRTVSATPKEPSGKSTAENVPGPLDAEIQQFKAETDHPEDWTDSELLAVAQQRRSLDLSPEQISERVNVSEAVTRRGLRKMRHAELVDTDDVRDEFRTCTLKQQIVIAANLAGAPDYTRSDLAELADCEPGSVGSTRRRFRPLIRRLDQVGLPNRLVPEPILDDLPERDDTDQPTDATPTDNASESSETEETNDDADAGNQNETESEREPPEKARKTTPEPTTSTVTIEDARRFVRAYKRGAITEHSRTDSPTAQQVIAAREATCEAILTYIETTHNE